MAAVASAALPFPSDYVQQCKAGNDSDVDECWICLSAHGELARVCNCPRLCHRECIATWQLTNYGRREENFCRFCNQRLPALWKPDHAKDAEKEELRVAPVMAVRYNGPEGTREFKLRVRPGPEGLAMFKAHLKEILGFDVGPEFDVTFECQMPSTGSVLTLSGLNAYGAATHCAALLAASKASPQSAAAPQLQLPPAAADEAPVVTPASMQQQQQGGSAAEQPLLPSEVPVATSTAGSTSGASSPAPCIRRICQTGYLPHGSVQQWDVAAGPSRHRHGGGVTSTHARSYLSRGRPSVLGVARSLGPAALSRALRTSFNVAELSEAQDLLAYDELYDDLLPLGPLHRGLIASAQRAESLRLGAGSGSGSSIMGRAVPTTSGSEETGADLEEVSGQVHRAATSPGFIWPPSAVRCVSRNPPVVPLGSSSAVASAATATASAGAFSMVAAPPSAVAVQPVAPIGAPSLQHDDQQGTSPSSWNSSRIVADSNGRGGMLYIGQSVADLSDRSSLSGSSHTSTPKELMQRRPDEATAVGTPEELRSFGCLGLHHRWGVRGTAVQEQQAPRGGRIGWPALLKQVAQRTAASVSRVMSHRKD